MIVFNFIFNIPFNLNFLGIVKIGVNQSKRSLFSTSPTEHHAAMDSDRISGDRLDKLLNAFSLALNNEQNRNNSTKRAVQNVRLPKIQRSSSTGRLPMLLSSETSFDINGHVRKRYTQGHGEGDH